MSVQETETAITQLSSPKLARLAAWFAEYQADAWDRQIERDVQAGRFEAIFQRVDEQAEAGQCVSGFTIAR